MIHWMHIKKYWVGGLAKLMKYFYFALSDFSKYNIIFEFGSFKISTIYRACFNVIISSLG